MRGSATFEVFKKMFPELVKDVERYKDSDKNSIIMYRKSIKPTGVYIFTFRNPSDFELVATRLR